MSGAPCALPDTIRAVLLDVTGTTTAAEFVKDTLFPFASSNAEEYLKTNWEDEAVKQAVKALDGEKELSIEEATKVFKELTDANSDNVGVKTLQGLIFKKGYGGGKIKAHVFPDVAPAFETWSKTQKIAIYSTGSVESQQLLFANTITGDLTAHISKYYDQETGLKTAPESYEKVAEDLGLKTEEIAFITDSVKEAEAAQSAKLEAILVAREGNEALHEDAKKQFKVIAAFSDITFEASSKRKNEEPEAVEERPAKLAKTEEAAASVEVAEEATEAMEVEPETNEAEAVAKVEDKTEAATEKPESSKSEDKKKEETETVDSTEKPTEEAQVANNEQVKVTEEKKEDVVESSGIEETEAKTEKADQPQIEDKAEEAPAESEKKTAADEKETAEETKETVTEEVKETAAEGEKIEDKTESEPAVEAEAENKEEKEKENKSELANGACATEQNGDVNGKTEEQEAKSEDSEIKVKKLEEAEETTTSVSVEA